MSNFWTHTIWYILLGVLTLFEVIYVMIKTEHRHLAFAFYITLLGIVLNIETLILIFLGSYAYYPMIIHSSPFDDMLAGNLFSQFSLAATALLIIVLDFNYYWFFIFAVLYGMLEEAFIALGVYSHNWYQTWMTVTGFPLYLWIAKKMYAHALRGMNPLFHYVYIYLGLFSLHVITIIWGLLLAGYIEFNNSVLADPIHSRYFLVLAIVFVPTSISMMIVYYSRIKAAWKISIVFALYAFYYLSYKFNLMWIKEGWFLLISTVLILWMYLSILMLDRLYRSEKQDWRE